MRRRWWPIALGGVTLTALFALAALFNGPAPVAPLGPGQSVSVSTIVQEGH